jgi:predicted RNase H-like HicB family nuclease
MLALRIGLMRYAVVIEKGERNYSAYVPDLPGCVSVGDTLEEVKAEIRDAIEFHLEGMREDGLPIPKPSSQAEYVEVGGKPSEEGGAWRQTFCSIKCAPSRPRIGASRTSRRFVARTGSDAFRQQVADRTTRCRIRRSERF